MRHPASSLVCLTCLMCLMCLAGAWTWPDASPTRRSYLSLDEQTPYRRWLLNRRSHATSSQRERADVLANRIGVPDEVDDPDARVRFDAPSNAPSNSHHYDTSRFPPRTPPAYAATIPVLPLKPAAVIPIRPSNPTPRPSLFNVNTIPIEGPSRCVWAIVSCCRPPSEEVRHACMESLGCGGPFWDNNPCGKRLTSTAAQAAIDFYAPL